MIRFLGPTTQQMRQPGRRQFYGCVRREGANVSHQPTFVRPSTITMGSCRKWSQGQQLKMSVYALTEFTSSINSALDTDVP